MMEMKCAICGKQLPILLTYDTSLAALGHYCQCPMPFGEITRGVTIRRKERVTVPKAFYDAFESDKEVPRD
jgi:hypothetical protein